MIAQAGPSSPLMSPSSVALDMSHLALLECHDGGGIVVVAGIGVVRGCIGVVTDRTGPRAITVVGSPHQWCRRQSGLYTHHDTLHSSEKTESATTSKKEPWVASQLHLCVQVSWQVLVVWCTGKHQCCADLKLQYCDGERNFCQLEMGRDARTEKCWCM